MGRCGGFRVQRSGGSAAVALMLTLLAGCAKGSGAGAPVPMPALEGAERPVIDKIVAADQVEPLDIPFSEAASICEHLGRDSAMLFESRDSS